MDGYWAEQLDLHYDPMTREWQENFTPVFFFFCRIFTLWWQKKFGNF
jgi:hypothetical protein